MPTGKSRYCISCNKRIDRKRKPKIDCEKCIRCFKKYIEILEINQFVDRMNEKYETDVPKIEKFLNSYGDVFK